jgi:hypothetical protein
VTFGAETIQGRKLFKGGNYTYFQKSFWESMGHPVEGSLDAKRSFI